MISSMSNDKIVLEIVAIYLPSSLQACSGQRFEASYSLLHSIIPLCCISVFRKPLQWEQSPAEINDIVNHQINQSSCKT